MNQSKHTNSFRANDSFTLEATRNLGDLLSASAARNPQKAAIAFEDRNISYESLEQATTRLAQWFVQQGCNPATGWDENLSAKGDIVRARLTIKTHGYSFFY